LCATSQRIPLSTLDRVLQTWIVGESAVGDARNTGSLNTTVLLSPTRNSIRSRVSPATTAWICAPGQCTTSCTPALFVGPCTNEVNSARLATWYCEPATSE
jgi:hypothetical protein